MYSQGLIGADSRTEETQEFLDAFQARIDKTDKATPTRSPLICHNSQTSLEALEIINRINNLCQQIRIIKQ